MIDEQKKQRVKENLKEIIIECEQIRLNCKSLIEQLNNVKTDEDSKNFDDKAYKMLSGFKHIEIF